MVTRRLPLYLNIQPYMKKSIIILSTLLAATIMNSCGNGSEPKVNLAEAQDQVTDTVTRKSLGAHAITLPQPVLIIGTYDENGVPNAMNVAWGGQVGGQQIELNLSLGGRKTIDNLKIRKAFTVAFATVDTEVAADYVGIVSGQKEPNKMEKSGLHAVKASKADAPMYVEFPVTVECNLRLMEETVYGEMRIVGDVVNVSAAESVLDENGKIDVQKAGIICFDPAGMAYRTLGDKVGQPFKDGNQLK